MSYKYTKILSSDSIGNSLSAINQNYTNLEQQTLIITASANNLWSFVQDYYINVVPIIKNAISSVNNLQANVTSTVTTVQNNSAGWLTPITVFYPTIFPSASSNLAMVQTVSAWANQNFPIYSSASTNPNFVEDQQLIVYSHVWSYSNSSISENVILTDSTQCATQGENICGTCNIEYSGGTYYGYGSWFSCDGYKTSCSVCDTLKCSFNSPPYVNITNNSIAVDGGSINISEATGFIQANVNMSFQDIFELQTINSFIFKIQNCNWVYQGATVESPKLPATPPTRNYKLLLQENNGLLEQQDRISGIIIT